MKSRSISVLVLILVAGAAMAASHTEMSPLRKLDPMVGKFQCKGIAYASPMGPEHATTATVEAKWVLDGMWANFWYTEKKTAENPKPFAVSGFMGYDMGKKKYVTGGVDNMGGYSTSEADGWMGNDIVFVGPYNVGGMVMKGRDTFTSTSKNELKHMFEVEENGTWKKMGQETCTRVK